MRRGDLRTLPFDAAAARDATLDDISEERVRWFLTQARQRQYPLADTTPPVDVLAHLNLLDGGRPTSLHFHGTEVRKPIPSYQVYKGTAFELVDQSVDFVMSKIARAGGTRAAGPQAPVDYELPRDAVAEAIVNAVAHRDYTSNASVQVMLFSDRLEIWNPGELPPSLTPERNSCKPCGAPRPSRRPRRLKPPLQSLHQSLHQSRRCWSCSKAVVNWAMPRSGKNWDYPTARTCGNTTSTNGFIEPTVPDKPTSRLQKYRLTEQGRTWLAVRPKK